MPADLPDLGNGKVWIRIPKNMHPKSWGDIDDPVVPFGFGDVIGAAGTKEQGGVAGAVDTEDTGVCFVARAVPKKEVAEVAAANEYCKKEWFNLDCKVAGMLTV